MAIIKPYAVDQQSNGEANTQREILIISRNISKTQRVLSSHHCHLSLLFLLPRLQSLFQSARLDSPDRFRPIKRLGQANGCRGARLPVQHKISCSTLKSMPVIPLHKSLEFSFSHLNYKVG